MAIEFEQSVAIELFYTTSERDHTWQLATVRFILFDHDLDTGARAVMDIVQVIYGNVTTRGKAYAVFDEWILAPRTGWTCTKLDINPAWDGCNGHMTFEFGKGFLTPAQVRPFIRKLLKDFLLSSYTEDVP